MSTNRDKLMVDSLAEELNKKFKNLEVAYVLGNDGFNPTNLDSWVSTGSALLDLAISNRPNGGLPVGRITELTGLEGSGKSLLAAHLLANIQKKGGLAIFIDTENAVDKDWLRALGVDINKLLYIALETVEDIFETVEQLIIKSKEKNPDLLLGIVIDSIAGATTKVESESDYNKDGWATSKAIVLSKAMRKITSLVARSNTILILTNQLRVKLGVMFGDPYTTSGGKAIAFHSSCRLRLKSIAKIKSKDKHGNESIVGIKTKAKVIKNRMGPPEREAEFIIFFDRGIDDSAGWLQFMKDHKLVKTAGAWYTYVDKSNNEHKFQAKGFEELITTNEELRSEIYQSICDEFIMKYQTSELSVDDIEISNEELPEDDQ